eukprot:748588_1
MVCMDMRRDLKSATITIKRHQRVVKKEPTKERMHQSWMRMMTQSKRNLLWIAFLMYTFILAYHITTQTSLTKTIHMEEHNHNIHRSNTVCEENQQLCHQLQHPICKYVMRHPVLQQSHHKTGHHLSEKLRTRILAFCLCLSHDHRINNKHNHIRNLFIKKLHVEPVTMHRALYETDFKQTVLLHYMRDPVETILSGFYYHIKASEKWICKWRMHDSLYKQYRLHNTDLYTDLRLSRMNEMYYYQKYFRVISQDVQPCFILPNIDDHLNTFYRQRVINTSFAFMSHLSVQTFYRTLRNVSHTDTMGLFWEFIRYYNCEWPHAYLMHQIGIKHFDHYHRFNLSDFDSHRGYNANINRLLDALNVVANQDNAQMLHRNGINYTVGKIKKERNRLLRMLQTEDVSEYWTKDDSRKKTRIYRESYAHEDTKHFTKGDYDKEESIKLLLTLDHSICNVLRNLTLWLDFEWSYSTFC